MGMSDLQFEQLFKLLDEDNSGTLEPIEMVKVFQAYETWQYEKEYKAAMEDLYHSNVTETISS